MSPIRTSTYGFLDMLGRKPTPPAPTVTPPVEAPKPDLQAAAEALYRRLGAPAPDDGNVQIPVPPRTRSLAQARLLAKAFGTHAEMLALGIPPEVVATYLDPANPSYRPPGKKAPVTPPPSGEIRFGPAPAPTAAPAPERPEETPARYVQPGARPRLGQQCHIRGPEDGGVHCVLAVIDEVYTGYVHLGGGPDSVDPVVRVVVPRIGPDRFAAITVYKHDANPKAAGPNTVRTWHRASGDGCRA